MYSSEQKFMTCAYTEREREPLCLNSAQLMKGELCGDVLTLGYGPNLGPRVRRVHRKFPERDLIFATTNLQPRALIQVGETLLRTFGVMLLILEVDETMRERGLVADNEVTEFGLVAWQK